MQVTQSLKSNPSPVRNIQQLHSQNNVSWWGDKVLPSWKKRPDFNLCTTEYEENSFANQKRES